MSNPSLASKLMSKVKGIFGLKEETAAQPGGQSASTERQAEAGQAESTAESTTATAANGTTTAPPAAKEETGEEPVPAAEDSVKAVEEDGAAEKTAPVAEDPAPAAEDSVKAVEEDGAAESTADLVSEQERDSVAEELAAAEATTQESDDTVLEGVRRQAAPAADELAVPGYDDLTLPSIRARLRKLTIDQVRDLRAYEVAHGERPEFIRMFDNRIAKLQNEGA